MTYNIGDTVTIKNRITKKTRSGEIIGYDDDNHPLGGTSSGAFFVRLENGRILEIDVADILSFYKIITPSGA